MSPITSNHIAFVGLLLMVQSTAASPLSTPSSASTDSVPSDLAATFPLQTRPFLTEPNEEPYLVREGEKGPELNCSVSKQYRDRSRYELEWTKIVGETPILVSRNERLFASSGADGYALSDTLAQNGEYHLRLKGIQFARDNGRFFCALIDTETRQQMLSEPAHVVVLVPPQAPLIVAQPTEAAREGEFVTVRCESQDGNPLPHFQWLFDNRTRVPDTWFHERHEGSGTRTRAISTLQWHLTRSDNGAYLTCQVWNKALKEGEFISAETNRLNVLYAPRVKVVPSVSELNIEEGERLDLKCTADANPPAANFEWTHLPSGEVHSEREWRVHVRRAHAGEFRCTATNSLDSCSERIRLNVLYGPTVHIRTANGGASGGSVVSPVEGERLVIDCEADANPKADAIAWTGPGGFQRNGSRLVIESVNRAHAGNFTCTAWNTLTLSSFVSKSSVSVPQSGVVIRAGFARVLVDVRRRPGPASISAKQTSLNVGEPITLGCGTDGDAGSPPARFRWAGPPTKGMYERTATEWNRAQLKLSDAQLAHNGVYRCVAFNELGQGEEASIRVTVVEPARISRPPMPTKILSNGATDVSIECEARGFPRPTVRWLRDDVQLPTDSFGHWTLTERPSDPFPDCRPEESCVHAVLSTLRFAHPVGWADKGNYTCEAQNSPTAQPTSGTSVLTVIHQPIVLNERFAEGMALAAAEPGTSTRIVCRISARPEPKVTWSRDGQEISADFGGGEYKRHLSKARDAVDEFESVLELREVTERHFGVFTCEARNGVGEKASVDIRLQTPSRPQTPLQARLLQSGLTWLMVGWRPAFDGGERQNFELEYRMVNPYSGKAGGDGQTDTFVFTSHNWTTMTFYGIDGDREFSARPDTYLVHNLTQLRPQSTFWYRVRARNSRGMSDWTAIANGETADARESMDIQAPEQAMYLADEQKLVVQPLRYSLSHCLLVYLSSEEDGLWRSLGCFPLAESDGIVHGILPAERFKVRYCMLNDLTKCSSGLKIFVEQIASAPSVWMIAFIFCSVSVLSLSILIALLCCRRRFQQKINAAVRRSATANGIMRPTKKKLNLNGGVVVDRIDIASPIASGGNDKNTAPNGSQTDSGVFTLGSNSATAAANAVAANGLVGGKTTGILLGAMCDEGPNFSPSGNSEWTNGVVASSLPQQQQQQLEPYDFSNDPFLQEFAAANALGGIVVVENALHQSSSTESSPSIGHQPGQQGKPPNPYSKFFNGFPSSLLGTGERGAANGSRAPPIAGGGEGGAGNSSNEQLIGAGSDSSASDSSSFRNSGGGVRVMREIIV